MRHFLTCHPGPAAGRPAQTSEYLQGRCLACTIGAKKAKDDTLFNVQAEVIQSNGAAVVFGETLTTYR